MNKDILKIVWQRYGKMLSVVFLLIIGIYGQSVISAVNNWQSQYRYIQRSDFKKDFEAQLQEIEKNGQPGVYLGYDSEKDEDLYTTSFSEYKAYSNENLKFWQTDGMFGNVASLYQPGSIFIYLTVIFGMMVFMFDNKSYFNQIWLSSRFSKKNVLSVKVLLFLAIFILANIIGGTLAVVIPSLIIPKGYLVMSIPELIPSMLAVILLGLTYFTSGMFAGLILGEWVSGLLTIIGFFYTLPMAVYEFRSLGLIITGKYKTQLFSGRSWPYKAWMSKIGAGEIPISQWIGSITLIILFIFVCYILFQKISTENNGKYLMFDFLKVPVKFITVLYVWVATSAVQLYNTWFVYDNYTLADKIKFLIINIMIIVITYLIVYFVIERKLPFRKKKLV